MAIPDVAAHLSPADLGRRYRAARDPVARSHLQIVWRRGQGRSEREVAAVTGYGRRWIGTIVQRYTAAGPDGLGDRRATNAGAKPLLDAEDEAALRAALAEPPADGGLWTGPKVATWMAARLGREVRPQRGGTTSRSSATAPSGPGRGTPRRRARRSRRRTRKAGRGGGRASRAGPGSGGRGVGVRRAPARPEAGAAPAVGARRAAPDRGRAPALRVALPLRFRPPGHGRGRLVHCPLPGTETLAFRRSEG